MLFDFVHRVEPSPHLQHLTVDRASAVTDYVSCDESPCLDAVDESWGVGHLDHLVSPAKYHSDAADKKVADEIVVFEHVDEWNAHLRSQVTAS